MTTYTERFRRLTEVGAQYANQAMPYGAAAAEMAKLLAVLDEIDPDPAVDAGIVERALEREQGIIRDELYPALSEAESGSQAEASIGLEVQIREELLRRLISLSEGMGA